MNKVILFLWFGDEKPSYIQWTLENFHKMNPGWEIRFIEYSTSQILNYKELNDPIMDKIMAKYSSKKPDYHIIDSYRMEYLSTHRDEFIIYCDLDCFPIAPFDDFIYDGFPEPNNKWFKFVSNNYFEIRCLGSTGTTDGKTVFGRDIWCISNNAGVTMGQFVQIHKDTRIDDMCIYEGVFMNHTDISKYRERHKLFHEMKLQTKDVFCLPKFTPVEHYPRREWRNLNQAINSSNENYIGYWKGQHNIGDLFSNLVLDAIYDKAKLNEVPNRKRMLFIGSDILCWCNGGSLCCGMGWQREEGYNPGLDPNKVKVEDFCYTRGKISRQRVIESGIPIPEDLPIGDTGILSGLIYSPKSEKVRDIGIVTHWQSMQKHDEFLKVAKNVFPDKVIDVACMGDKRMNVEDMLEFIAGSKMVLSGSLHGLIFSHSLGVPALFFSNQKGYKYRDYYSAYDRIDYRDLYKWTTLYEVCKKASNQEFVESVNPTKSEVEQVQKNIIKALPYKECFTDAGKRLLAWANGGVK